MAAVIKACEERDTAHTKETEVQKQAIKTSDPEDPVIHLLEVTRQAVCAQAVRDIETFLKKIKETLHQHMPVSAQGPLIVNAMSTALTVPDEHVVDGGQQVYLPPASEAL